uniref:Ras-GAP domain-containing protein n=1 Tax=Gongylonema pulchrum TaxID=637853 RepID=A0A183EEX5_9BILA
LTSNVLLPMCFRISDLVAPVVNSMSPEGYAPEDYVNTIADVKNFETLKSRLDVCQMLLTSCWRSHKYVSAIFHTVVTKLTECKHCGAIETAIEGFEALCEKLWSLAVVGDADFREYPKPSIWIEQIISLLDGETS